MSSKKKIIPAIRFKGYSDDWKQRKLNKIVKRVTRKNKNLESNLPLTISAQHGLIDQNTFFNKQIASKDVSGYYLVKKGEFAYNKSYSAGYPWGAIKRLDHYDLGVLSTLYIIFKPTDIASGFLVPYYDTNFWHKEVSMRAAEGARNHGLLNISAQDFFETELKIPSSTEEQEEIGSFFKQLEDTIALHQRQLDNYKELKKTMLQKMLPQNGEIVPKVRFSGFTENWKQHKLKELLIERNIKQTPTKDIPLVSFTVEDGVTPKSQRYDREFLVRDSEKKYKLTKLDDIVYNPANLKFGAIARNKLGTAVFSPIYITFETNQIPFFIELLVTRNDFINKSLKYQEGTVYERKAVKPEDFLSISTRITSIPEQNKIGEFFQLFDDYIFLHQKKIQDYQQIKKNMLQRMFV